MKLSGLFFSIGRFERLLKLEIGREETAWRGMLWELQLVSSRMYT